MADARPWFRVDVGYFSNPKVAPLLDDHPRAVVFHLECIAYAKQHRTDGVVPMRVAMRIACAEQCDVDAAHDAGLISHIDGRNVMVHDYEEHQGSSDADLKRSEAAKAAARARWDQARNADGNTEAMRIACGTHSDTDAETNASGNADKTRQDNINTSVDSEDRPTLELVQDEGSTAADADRFEEFWRAYPKRSPHSNPKAPAKKKWSEVTRKVHPQILIDAAHAYAKVRRGEDPKYTAQTIKWLRDERWNDDIAEQPDEDAWPDERRIIGEPPPEFQCPDGMFGDLPAGPVQHRFGPKGAQ